MKNFSKYIVQGVGLAIGVIIILGAVVGVIKIKNNIEQQKIGAELQKIEIAQAKKEVDTKKLIEIGFSSEQAYNAIENGIDIEYDGEYDINVVSGKGNVTIYDMITGKYIKTIDSVNKDKVSSFNGEPGYKVIPDEGLIIECIKK